MYGQPTFGGGVPHYGPAPTMPGPPKHRSPLRLVVLALIATHPRLALVVLAYTYLASAFIGLAYSKLRTRPVTPPAAEP